MTTPDINVVVMDFKTTKANEMVTINEDGSYTILVNARLSHTGQLKAYNHALKHIHERDFEKTDVQSIEASAHNITIPENAEKISGEKFTERIEQLRRERRRIQRQLKKEEERVRFMIEECGIDMFARAEDYKLYGDDL